jgi:hypothetical protein
MNLAHLRALWSSPPPEFSPVPFWFWNGELTDEEIRRQLRDFREHAVWGVIPHARVPLPESIGFLTERWFHFIGVCLEEARRLGMTVWLYDEGMYPSGSAAGRVVHGHPEFRCQALVRVEAADPSFPAEGEVVARDERHVYLRVFPNAPIRGLGYGLPPLAADLLNPQATARFLQEAYDPYWERFREHFGNTVRGVFTDEPHFLGRGGKPSMRPWTADFPRFFHEYHGWDLLPRLAALWEEGTETEPVRLAYRDARDALLDRAYYRPLSEWCAERGVALFGHPSGMGELGHLRYFQIPGQDVVWRQVTPEPWEKGGPDSVLGKISSSAAHTYGRSRNCNEVYGAYGWELTSTEMKWLADWLMVRGVDMLVPHAFYYTLEGDARHERPPDVGPGAPWWPFYRLYAEYVTRLCALLNQGRHACSIAVYDQGNETDPQAGYWLLQLQRDFDYLERSLLEAETCSIEGGQLWLEHSDYRVLLLDGVERLPLASMRKIHAFAQAGGIALALERRPRFSAEAGGDAEVDRLSREVWPEGSEGLVAPIREELGRALARCVPGDARCEPPAPSLRSLHRRTPAGEVYFLTNESPSETVRCEITLQGPGAPEAWDAETGDSVRLWHYVRDGAAVTMPVRLRPYESRVVVLTRERDPLRVIETDLDEVTEVERTGSGARVTGWTERGGRLSARALDGFDAFGGEGESPPPPDQLAVRGPWQVTQGEQKWTVDGLLSWTEWSDPRFSGFMEYETEFALPEGAVAEEVAWTLDLGRVCEFAETWLNGQSLGAWLWPPFRWAVAPAAGRNRLRVRVWNSLANRYEGKERPSGLLGPVRLEARRRVTLDLSPTEPPEFPVSLV